MVTTGANAVAPVDTPASATVGIDTVMAAPKFPQPMYEPLRDLSQELLLPGLDTVPPDAVLGLKTNRRFVEAYMVGLNVEMAQRAAVARLPDRSARHLLRSVLGRVAPRPPRAPTSTRCTCGRSARSAMHRPRRRASSS